MDHEPSKLGALGSDASVDDAHGSTSSNPSTLPAGHSRGRRRSSDRVMVLMASAPSKPRRLSSSLPPIAGALDSGAVDADILDEATAMLELPEAGSQGRRGRLSAKPASASGRRESGEQNAEGRSMEKFVEEAQAEAEMATRARQRRLSAAVRGDSEAGKFLAGLKQHDDLD